MPILLYGATGTAGRRVAEALTRDGHDVIVAGRNPERVRPLAEALGQPWRIAPIEDSRALERAAKDAALVLSCAGPFSELGEPLLRAALAAGAAFADISGEQAYARDMFERYESRARHARLALATGLGFEPAAGDWAAALAAAALGPGHIDEIVIAYAISRIPLTRGTIDSMRASLAAPASEWSRDRWESARPGQRQQLVGFPPPFGARLSFSAPLAAAITVPRHIETARITTLIAAGAPSPARKLALRLASVAAPVLPAVARSPFAAELSSFAPFPPTEDEPSRTGVAVVAEARRGFERSRIALTAPDLYQLTAEIAALAAPALAHRERALAPSEVVEPAEALETLQQRAGLSIERGR